MPVVTLRSPRSYTVHGQTFKKGVPTSVSREMMRALLYNDHFKVEKRDAPVASTAVPAAAEDDDELPVSGSGPTLLDAADSLDIDDESNFDDDGKPAIAALSRVMGRPVSVEERDGVLRKAARSRQPANPDTGRIRIVRRSEARPDPTTDGAVAV